jgi:hypothetical protein
VDSSLLPHPAEVLALAIPLVVAVVLVAGLVVLLRRSAEVRRRVTALEQHRPAGDADLAALRADLGQALRHVAVVRYDAFGDMGGHLSWSLALLDDAGNGVVLTSIHGRSDARTYAKNVTDWSSQQQLSPEEEEAIAHAHA